MSFSITDYLDELEGFVRQNTWAEAKCPVCKGKLKINLSTKKGAYACYTEGCHSFRGKNLIREKLYRPSVFKKGVVFTRPVRKQELPELVKELKNIETDIYKYKSLVKYNSLLKLPTPQGIKTIYKYPDFQVCRVDTSETKYFYTEYWDTFTGRYVQGIPSVLESLPIYGLQYIQPCIFMVEGEKCADAMHKLNFACLSPHASFFTSDRLSSIFIYLKAYGIKSLIYLEDNDLPGKKKGEWVATSAWLRGIDCVSFNTAQVFSVDTMEYDIADAVSDGFDIETKIQEYVYAYFNR